MPTATQTTPDYDELRDSELLKRYVDHRDERAFAELFARWNQKLRRFINSKIGDWDTAEELTQHAWERAFLHAHRFQWDKTFSTWIYTIADNLAKNQLRNRSRTPITLYQRIRDKWNIEEGQDRGLEWADKTYAPDKEAQKRELEHRVMEATEQLKPQHRVVFVLREFEGLEYEEIEEMTGVKLGTVKSRLSRARQHFRDALLDAGLAAADLDQLDIPEVEAPSEKIIDLNTAGAEELCTLPEVGPVGAQEIIEARPFESVEELEEVDGLSRAIVEEIRPLVRLSCVNLAELDVTVNGTNPLRTVRWSKGYNGPSAVHAVSSSDEEGLELLLECGAELPISEREGVELNPQESPTCQRCKWAVEADEPVAA